MAKATSKLSNELFQSLNLKTWQQDGEWDYSNLVHQGDPLADDFISKYPGKPLLDLLEILFGSNDPLSLQLYTVPSWVDHDAIYRGSQLQRIYSPMMGLIRLYGALTAGFSFPRMNATLVKTGLLSNDRRSFRRLVETASLIHDCMTPGGLVPGAIGWKSVIEIRIRHALVRSRLRKIEQDGVPINQADMIATIMAFQVVTVIGMTKFGVHLSRSQREDFTQIWRYVSYLIGIDDEVNPLAQGFIPSLNAFGAYVDAYFAPDDVGRELAAGILRVVSRGPDGVEKPNVKQMNLGMSWLIIGPMLSSQIGLEKPSWLGYFLARCLIWVIWVKCVMNTIPWIGPILCERDSVRTRKMITGILFNLKKLP